MPIEDWLAARVARQWTASVKMRLHRELFDYGFDQRLGVQTCGRLWRHELDWSGDNAAHAIEYEPTPSRVFARMVRSLGLDLTRFTFIDLGSGKGRNLLLAAQMGFARVEGIELSSQLHKVALKNISVTGAGNIEIVCHNIDAVDYQFPPAPFVIFAFHPFQEPVVSRVLCNLAESLNKYPREGYVLYLNPHHKDLLDRSPQFMSVPRPLLTNLLDWAISPWPFAIYRTRFSLTPELAVT